MGKIIFPGWLQLKCGFEAKGLSRPHVLTVEFLLARGKLGLKEGRREDEGRELRPENLEGEKLKERKSVSFVMKFVSSFPLNWELYMAPPYRQPLLVTTFNNLDD